jgi:hypothetical protein
MRISEVQCSGEERRGEESWLVIELQFSRCEMVLLEAGS